MIISYCMHVCLVCMVACIMYAMYAYLSATLSYINGSKFGIFLDISGYLVTYIYGDLFL